MQCRPTLSNALLVISLAAGGCTSDEPSSTTTSSGSGGDGGQGATTSSGTGGTGGSTSSGTGGGGAGGGGGGGGTADPIECADWQNQHPSWLWCDDFEQEQDLTQNYQDFSLNGFSVNGNDAFSGAYAIEQLYTQGQVDAGWISWFYADALGNDYGPSHDEIYVRWYHKFEANFDGFPPKMARLRSLGPGWDKRFSVLYWIADGKIVADVHVPFSSQANSSGWLPVAVSDFDYNNPANVGRWICHEMYVKTNTSGQADGAYRFWADGQMIIERTGVDLRGSTSFEFNEVMLDTYWNGGSPVEQSRYYDNLVISTSPIGCVD